MIKITPYEEDVYAGKICPYCKSSTRVTTQVEVYGMSYSGTPVIVCKNYPKCDSYVGTDKKTNNSLGRLSSKELRILKMQAHKVFDILWIAKHFTRNEIYQKLSEELGIPFEYCHIGNFNIQTTMKVIDFAKKEHQLIRNKIY